MDEQGAALIGEHVRHVLQVMGFEDVQVQCHIGRDDAVRVDIQAGEQGRLLIGVHGNHLMALQHIVRCLLRQQMTERAGIVVDVNGYQARRERSLLEVANDVANKAQRTGRSVVMEPMSAADRRTVHNALAQHQNIQTESLGEEPNRRVVVRPVFL